ncbi:LOW QUALITY PROTEIN: transcriptional repressor ILP1-like [Typha angustifolia]|uniref:LOW QUALITY PROTEIN: transcriptional repressor ILP1-like n=1 Tax=Typha angustifolia TaxID=59011 RepID=UPI003C3081EB
MSSSRAKNFRRRSDTGDANGEEKPSPKPSTIASTSASISTNSRNQAPPAAKPKSSKPQGPKRLSFADDEEEEEDGSFALPSLPTRKFSSAASVHKLSASKDRSKSLSSVPPIPSNVQPQTGEYTKERLRELQKNARPLGSLPKPQTTMSFSETKSQKSDRTAEPVIVLKGLMKPMTTTSTRPEEEKESTAQEKEEEEEEEEQGDRDDTEKGRKLPVIPDQATINAIRAKRQQLQQPHRPLPDFISLDSSGMISSRASAGGSSDEEDNDLQGRIAMFEVKNADVGPKKDVYTSIKEKVPSAVNNGFQEVGFGDGDEDEEERKWEEEQFRKGLGRRLDETSVQRGSTSTPSVASLQPQPSINAAVAHRSLLGGLPLGDSVVITRSAEVMSIAQQAEIATRALQENINKLRESHKTTLNSLVRTDTHISEALSEISTVEESLEATDKKYVFMQQLRDFISVMCDFLNDKAFYIEELEEQMQKLHEKRALAVSERRSADFVEEGNEMEAAVSAAIQVLSKGSGSAYILAATNAAQAAVAAAARDNSNLPVELDEFGRDINLKKHMDFTRRAEYRKQRKARSESKRMLSMGKSNVCEHIEGELSTDESDSESDAYLSSRNELLLTAEQIFSDASEKYSNLKIVKEKFEGWKNQYPSTYRDAYVSLSVPTLFTPYVRLDLLKWDPLYDTIDFFDMEWHRLLFNYGLPGKVHDFDPDDADANLIPELVEKVALPILHHEIAHCWDILSTQRTKNAVFATNMVVNYVPSSSRALHELLAVVHRRLTEAISNLNVPSWGTVVTNAVPDAAQFAAYRFGMSVRLLGNICLWKNIIALPVLEKLALEELLRGKLLPHVKSIISNIHDAITRTERIVVSLPGVWSGPEVTVDPTPKLQPLVDFVAELGNKLEKRRASGVSEEDTRLLARRLKNMFVALNEYDKARVILRTFQLKEAL